MTSPQQKSGQHARHRRSPADGPQTSRNPITDIHDQGAPARMGLLASLLLLFVGLLATLLYLLFT